MSRRKQPKPRSSVDNSDTEKNDGSVLISENKRAKKIEETSESLAEVTVKLEPVLQVSYSEEFNNLPVFREMTAVTPKKRKRLHLEREQIEKLKENNQTNVEPNGDNLFVCTSCSLAFASRQWLERHRRDDGCKPRVDSCGTLDHPSLDDPHHDHPRLGNPNRGNPRQDESYNEAEMAEDNCGDGGGRLSSPEQIEYAKLTRADSCLSNSVNGRVKDGDNVSDRGSYIDRDTGNINVRVRGRSSLSPSTVLTKAMNKNNNKRKKEPLESLDSNNVIMCSQCDYKVDCIYRLGCHIRTVHGFEMNTSDGEITSTKQISNDCKPIAINGKILSSSVEVNEEESRADIRCPSCQLSFDSFEDANLHFVQQHVDTLFRCSLCLAICEDMESMESHILQHHMDPSLHSNGRLSCDSKSTSSSPLINDTIREFSKKNSIFRDLQQKESNFNWKCEFCECHFETIKDLSHHKVTRHTSCNRKKYQQMKKAKLEEYAKYSDRTTTADNRCPPPHLLLLRLRSPLLRTFQKLLFAPNEFSAFLPCRVKLL